MLLGSSDVYVLSDSQIEVVCPCRICVMAMADTCEDKVKGTCNMSLPDMVSSVDRFQMRLENSHMSLQRCMRQAIEFANHAVVSQLEFEVRRLCV